MSCDGFAAEVYDLFAVGALEGEDRLALERHLSEACETCLVSLKRSLSNWAGFAVAMTENETAPNLRSRIVRMAELSKTISALSDPSQPVTREPRVASSWFVRGMAASITIIVGAAAWYAGRQSAEFGTADILAGMDRIQKESARTRAELETTKGQRDNLAKSLVSANNGTIAADQAKLQAKVQRQEAEIGQLNAELKREEQTRSANARITGALATPGVRFVQLKGVEGTAHTSAYSIITESGRVVLIASGLPVPAPDRRYQLWLLRKDDPQIKDGGLFNVEADGRAVFEAYNATLTTGITGIAVTEEPQSGSPAPTSTPILTGTFETSQQ